VEGVVNALVLVAALAAARPLPPIPRYEVHRARGPIAVDGKLDDAAWKNAPAVRFVFPWEQQTGAKQATTARLLWDERALYVAYDCDDSEITVRHTRRDDPTYEDDAVEIFLNPDPAQDFYYGFEMNARGVLYDYFFAFPRVLIKRVDLPGTRLAAAPRPGGWALEVAIPWDELGELAKKTPPAPGTTWTANLNRWDGTVPRRRLSQWSDSGKAEPDPHAPARFGQLVFSD
jgi:hypothetical protein